MRNPQNNNKKIKALREGLSKTPLPSMLCIIYPNFKIVNTFAYFCQFAIKPKKNIEKSIEIVNNVWYTYKHCYLKKAGIAMEYSAQEILQFVNEEDVKFIRLAFCDVYGKQKNISIMPNELTRAFSEGIPFDSSAIAGFGDESHSDLLLHPDPSTLSILPWRPEHGRVVRMFCDITYPDGRVFERDTRTILKNAVKEAKKAGITFDFGSETEFYLFKEDENGNPTFTPHDNAGYMDIAPLDKGENVRREICLTLEQMGIRPESSHHEEGPGQNEIDFRCSSPLSAADNAMTFQTVVAAIAHRNGLWADFSARPIENMPGNGFHISIAVKDENGNILLPQIIAGLLENISDMTLFLNPTETSYKRFGTNKAPKYISWSSDSRSQLVRVPVVSGGLSRADLRSPDPMANTYLAFALIIYSCIAAIKKNAVPPTASDINFFNATEKELTKYKKLPQSLDEAKSNAKNSEFIKTVLPQSLIDAYLAI